MINQDLIIIALMFILVSIFLLFVIAYWYKTKK